MKEYLNKEELGKEIKRTADLFIQEFKEVSEQDSRTLMDGVDRTPVQMIAYQLGWLRLMQNWDKEEAEGKTVVTPAPGFKWNQMGKLYESFYEACEGMTLKEQQEEFVKEVQSYLNWLASLSEEKVFTPGVCAWASSTPSNWPVWKWIHMNTVAPFTSFRSKIRKWKKLNK